MSTPTSAARSSLEEMLEAIRARETKPKPLLPALPTRPAPRVRLPSQKRTLPFCIEAEETEEERGVKEYQEFLLRRSVFGRKRLAKMKQPEECPYVKMTEFANYKPKLEDAIRFHAATALLSEKFKWGSIRGTASKKKLQAWCQLPDASWQLVSIDSVKREDANILLSDGKVLTVAIESLLPANPNMLDDVDDVDDLVQLSYLHEASVLHSLKCRYSNDKIYTKAGQVLVAINPFKKLPIYGNDCVAAYKTKTINSPHVYSVADTAFSKMMRDGVNQSIIVSGESGSGKTETAKIAMQYLAALGGGSGTKLEVLHSNFLLEAFGNAKTSRNDNASRFGKYFELHFSMSGKICGAKIHTSLLEKSRVVKRAKGERSYHVFYQLCAGAQSPLKEKLNLQAANEYGYLKQSDCLSIENVDDAKKFHELTEALNILGISKENQENVFVMLAAILWLGNIEFSVINDENHIEVVLNDGVINASKLMGCSIPQLVQALSTRKSQVENDEMVQTLTLSQAIDTRDALSKSIYASLFNWLVEQINKSLEAKKPFMGLSINILDIYGFESLHKNQFEQICINYANERLQHHFNRHLFKLEQEEYIQDGIDWTSVEYTDNTECLYLFEKKSHGLLSLLDEESASHEATDLTFTDKLKEHLNGNPCFIGENEGSFQVHHYAGKVAYDSKGFLESNRDLLHSDCIQLLLSCACPLLELFAARMLIQSQNPLSSIARASSGQVSSGRVSCDDSRKQCIAAKLKGQLFKLMQQLENTTPHFILCIKPNNNHLPGLYEDDLVLHQLRSYGLLGAVKISRSGFPTRLTHRQFAERYGFLLMENDASKDPFTVAIGVLQKFNVLPETFQVGYTKLFFRPGQISALENIKIRTMQKILWVQKTYHDLQDRRRFQKLRKGATTLQSFIRGSLVRTRNTSKRISETESQHHLANQVLIRNEEATKEENAMLRKQLQEYQMRLAENEAKLKSVQEALQKQVAALQTRQANIASTGAVPSNPEILPHPISQLAREFEDRKQAFEDDAWLLSPQTSKHHKEELRKLKALFETWKKDYHVRLKNAKATLRNRAHDGEMARKKWCLRLVQKSRKNASHKNKVADGENKNRTKWWSSRKQKRNA